MKKPAIMDVPKKKLLYDIRHAYEGNPSILRKPISSMLCKWQEQPMNMSAFSIVGPDIGGFVALPEGELYAQWIQLVLFHPFCRTQSSGDHGNDEP